MYLLLRADQRQKQHHKDAFLPAHPQKLYPLGKESWTDIEPQDYSSIDFPVSKQLSTLLRHGNLPREDDGAIEFWSLEDYLRNHFEQSQHWSDEKWKSTMAKSGGKRKRFQYCTDPHQDKIFFTSERFKVIRAQSHWSFVARQCFNSERFLRVHSSHRMCNQFTLHHEFRIDTGRTKFEQKTDGILHACGSHEQRTQRS